jgi:hypothetical protein
MSATTAAHIRSVLQKVNQMKHSSLNLSAIAAIAALLNVPAVGAFPLVSGSKDSALLLTLQPGAYTMTVTSPSGSTGVALVEVYDTQ